MTRDSPCSRETGRGTRRDVIISAPPASAPCRPPIPSSHLSHRPTDQKKKKRETSERARSPRHDRRHHLPKSIPNPTLGPRAENPACPSCVSHRTNTPNHSLFFPLSIFLVSPHASRFPHPTLPSPASRPPRGASRGRMAGQGGKDPKKPARGSPRKTPHPGASCLLRASVPIPCPCPGRRAQPAGQGLAD